MAAPKRTEVLSRKRNINKNVKNYKTSEYSLYLALKYDYDNNALPEFKANQYLKMRDKYEK